MYGSTQYGSSLYSQDNQDNHQIETLIPDLMKYLPKYYEKSKVMKSIQQAIAKGLGVANYDVEEVLNQFFVDTATWGLSLWEEDLGIITDMKKSYEARREIIKAKLRGSSSVTRGMLKNTALAYTNAEIDVIEKFDDYSFIVKFISVKGIPENLNGFKQTIEEIKPAHLDFSIEYTYNVWNFLKEKLTWTEPKSKGSTWNNITTY